MKGKKQDLRIEAARQRESLPPSEVHSRSQMIQEAAIRFAPYLAARAVALYSPIGNEVFTGRIRDHAFETRKFVYYPGHGDTQRPILIRVQSVGDLQPGRYGILESAGDQSVPVGGQEGLAVFVPGLSFDLWGHRLGRGKGWYDRLLRDLRGRATFIALAYEFQIVDNVPVDALDQRVQHIITESRMIDCRDVDSSRVGFRAQSKVKGV